MVRLARVVVIAAAIGTLASAAPRGGKVVRIERARGLGVVPQLCDVQVIAKAGQCVGQPKPGERVVLIDTERGKAVGEFRIDTSSEAGDPFVCLGTAPTVFQVGGSLTVGDANTIGDSGRLIGLRNLPYDARIRVIKDQALGGKQEKAELALDLDGNDRVDYMLVRYGCDELNRPVPTADRRFCFDTYLERRGKLVKVHTDNIQICYR